MEQVEDQDQPQPQDQEVCVYCSDNREVLHPEKRMELLCGHWTHTFCFLARFADHRLYTVDCYRCNSGICGMVPDTANAMYEPTEETVRENLLENQQLQIELCALSRLYREFLKKDKLWKEKLRPIVNEWKEITRPHIQALRAYKTQFSREISALPEKRQAMKAYGVVTRMFARIQRQTDISRRELAILSDIKIRNRSLRFLRSLSGWRFRHRRWRFSPGRMFYIRI
jgi:hypothetical protein